MFQRIQGKAKVVIAGNPPNIFVRISSFVMLSLILIIPLTIYLILVNDSSLNQDYRNVIAEIFIFDRLQLNGLPSGINISGLNKAISTSLNLQIILSSVLLVSLFVFNTVRYLIKKLTSRSVIYSGAISAGALRFLVYRIFTIKARIFNNLKPYVFYTSTEVEIREVKYSISKSLWITLVIFAASFQFAGLFYTQTQFPRLLGANFSLLDASVVFMILSGTIWLTFLLGVDLLERFDIQILDLSNSKLTNIGKSFNRISRRGFSFLTISFLILTVQDFNLEDWLQSVVFLDIFCLITLWILLGYESNLEDIGHQIRDSLDRHTLSGAERIVINKEKKRLGNQKLDEAEEKMKEAEKRIILAERVNFPRVIFGSIILITIIFSITVASITAYLIFFEIRNQFTMIYFEISFSVFLVIGMLVFQTGLSKNEFTRSELVFFPLFFIGNAITHYLFLIDTKLTNVEFYISIVVFNLLWFFTILRNIYPRIPGREFWGIVKKVIFSLTLLISWSISIYLQLVYFIGPTFYI